MIKIQEMNETYFVFSKIGDSINKTVGPIFKEDIEDEIKDFFEEGEKYEVLTEEMFALIYSDEYKQDKSFFWVDYMATLLDKLKLDYNIDQDSIENDSFCAFIDGDGDLAISFSILQDPSMSAIIAMEVQKAFDDVFDIKVNSCFYLDKEHDNEVFMNDQAYSKHFANSAMKTFSPN